MEMQGDAPIVGLGALASRAYDLLDTVGKPVTEERLVRHVFGLTGTRKPDFWRGQLTRVLAEQPHFTQLTDGTWSLSAWQRAAEGLRDLQYVVVDVETTGLSPKTQNLIEIAAIRCKGSAIVESFTTLINPQKAIPPFIRSFTGISDDMVTDAPTANVAVRQFLDFAGDDILVGHNVRFDLNFIGAVAENELGVSIANDNLDTIALGTRFLPGLRRPSLDRLAGELGLATPNRHRAMADAELTAQAFWRLIDHIEAAGIANLERLQVEVGAKAGPLRRKVFSSGRTGRTILNPALRQGLPQAPGVYLMKNDAGDVIYVGKAKNIRNRVSSYYSQPLGYRRKTDGLLESIASLDTIVVGSELHALLLENQLIKEYLPRFNVQQRNYEHYPFIKVDVQNAYPRVYGTREIAADGARYFGPYRSSGAIKVMINVVQRLFSIRTCTRKLSDEPERTAGGKGSPCLRYGLGRCLAPCHGHTTVELYREVIDEVCDFLGGTRDELLNKVRAELFRASEHQNYERAAQLRDLLRDAQQVLVAQQLVTGAVEKHNLLIIYASSEAGHAEVFGIRHGRLQEQQRIKVGTVEDVSFEVDALCNRLLTTTEPPSVVANHEVDSINIIARWIYRHSHEQRFIPLLGDLNAVVKMAVSEILQNAPSGTFGST